jgi:hypothetical protein
MAETSITKVNAKSSPKGAMGQKYLASGVSMAMRLWEDEQPGQEKTGKPARLRNGRLRYQGTGRIASGRTARAVRSRRLLGCVARRSPQLPDP